MRNTDGSYLPYTHDYGEDPYVTWDEEIFKLNNGYAANLPYSLKMSLENAKEGEEIWESGKRKRMLKRMEQRI